MGQPIEDAAHKAVKDQEDGFDEVSVNAGRQMRYGDTDISHHANTNPVEHYAEEALKATIAPAELTPLQVFLLAQQKFIVAQTIFIHDQKNLQLMLYAQSEFLVALIEYVGSQDMPAVLSLQERCISELQALIDQRNLF